MRFGTSTMSDTRKAVTAFAVVIAGATAWMARAEAPAFVVDPLPFSVTASGALAWADAHCDIALRLAPEAPRLMPEDLIAVSAALDVEAARNGREATCEKALAASKSVADASGEINAPQRPLGDDAVALGR